MVSARDVTVANCCRRGVVSYQILLLDLDSLFDSVLSISCIWAKILIKNRFLDPRKDDNLFL